MTITIMKTSILLLFTFLFSFSNAQQAIEDALSKGNTTVLGEYFPSQVEMAVLNQEDSFSKTRALSLLSNFFEANKPTKYKRVHNGSSKDNLSFYTIGELTTSKGVYRVYLYFDKKTNLISELRIEK